MSKILRPARVGEARAGEACGVMACGVVARGVVAGAVAVAAALALPGGLAYAKTSPPPVNLSDASVAASASVGMPVNACGISIAILGIAILGDARSSCQGGSAVSGGPGILSDPAGTPRCLGSPGSPGSPGTSGTPGTPGTPGNPGGLDGGPPFRAGTKSHETPRKHHLARPGHGHRGGSTTSTTASSTTAGSMTTSTAVLSSGRLPVTGFNLVGILAAGFGCIATGVSALAAGRLRLRRRQA